MHLAFFVVLGCAAGTVLLSWVYFRRYSVARPPVGVMGLTDVAILLVAIVLIPYLYLAPPLWLVAAFLGAAVLSALYLSWEPVLRARWAIWLVSCTLLAADTSSALGLASASNLFFAVNNLVLALAVVGIANLWAQSGLKARDTAILAAALAVYDFIATSRLPLMDDLIDRLAGIPFAPLLAWDASPGAQGLGVGLGDLLLAATFPLVLRKAFGRPAGALALGIGLAAIAGMLALLDLRIVGVTLPAMVALGPLFVLQYTYWRHRSGPERATWQYLQAEQKAGLVTTHP